TPARLEVDFPTLVAQKDAIIRDYRDQHYASTSDEADGSNSVQVVHGRAVLVDPHTAEVSTPDGSLRRLSGDQVLVATGSAPVVPDVAGLAGTPYLTSDLLTSEEDQELTELPSSLVILGGGYIALELGQLFARLGTKVTILERSGRILRDYEPEIGKALADILRDEGIHLLTRVEVQHVAGDASGVRVSTLVRGEPQQFQAAKLLVAT